MLYFRSTMLYMLYFRSTYAGAENLFCRALCFRGRVGEGEDEGAWAVLRYLADEGLLEKP